MKTATLALALALVACAAASAAAAEFPSVRSANLDRIAKHNAAAQQPWGPSYTLGANQFWNLTPEEFSARFLREKRIRAGRPTAAVAAAVDPSTLPASVDWRKHGDVPPVMNQGQMGSVGPITATEAIESAAAISSGHMRMASPDTLAQCATSCQAGFGAGCYLAYAAKHGLCTGASGTCHCADPIKVTSYGTVTANSSMALQAAVAKAPVIAAVDASSTWQFYAGGVISGPCGESLDHEVLIVGYGATESGSPYWIAQNSWGASWGMDGYALLARTSTDGAGECGVAMDALFVTAE